MSGVAFLAIRHPSLKAAGLWKGAWVSRGEAGLHLQDPDGASLTLPWSSLRKVRIGAYSPKYGARLYRMTVWTTVVHRPLRLATVHRDEAAFKLVAREAAQRVLAEPDRAVLEGGLGWWDALNCPLFFAIAMVLAFLATTHDPTMDHAPSDLMPTALFFLGFTAAIETVLWVFFVRPYRPRRLATAAELDGFLPGAKDPGA
jgi:hypothetical protein